MRRLNATHVERTVKDALDVTASLTVADERLFTYRSNVSTSVDDVAVHAYLDFAERVAAQVSLTPCTRTGCAAWLFDDIAPRLFRRPLEGEQRTRYQSLFDRGLMNGGAVTEAARWVLESMLQSPAFLYLDEPLDTAGLLDGYGVAARLSLMFWGANPDTALLDAARKGELGTPDGIRLQARAMLADPRSENGLHAFVSQWLELERLNQTDARPDLQALGPEVLAALTLEPVQVVRLATVGGANLQTLLTSPRTVSLPALVGHYGRDIVSSGGGRTELDPARRSGLLTLPGVMAALAHAGVTSPTARGYAILANLMCTPPPPPPPGVSTAVPPVMPGSTTRERLEAHFSDAACASCHRAMDGLGFAFEHYDQRGQWRDTDNGKAIDDHAELELGADPISITGAAELARVLAARAEVRECFARQWTRYATGIPERGDVGCLMAALGQRAAGAGRGLEDLMVELAASDYVRKGSSP